MTDILTIGEPLVLFASTDLNKKIANATHFTKYLAGAEINFAIGTNRLGHSVEYFSQIGVDPLGEFINATLQSNGIRTDHIISNKHYTTGIEFKTLTDHGDPETFYIRKNSAATHLTSDQINNIDVSNYKLAHITGIFPSLSKNTYQTTVELIKKLRVNNVPISFDPNLRPALWASKEEMCSVINQISHDATIFLPGIKEAQTLTNLTDIDEIANYYFQHSPVMKLIVIKDGSRGAYIRTRSGQQDFVPSFKVKKVVDTVGAGDGFALGLDTALLEGKDLKHAVACANAIGALAIQSQGDNTGYPTPAELADFIKTNQTNQGVKNAKD